MRKVRVEHASEGSKLSEALRNKDGTIFLQKGVILNSYLIRRLKSHGYNHLYVENDSIANIKMIDSMVKKTRIQADTFINQFAKVAIQNDSMWLYPVERVVYNILDEIIENKDLVLHLANLGSHDTYTLEHCINVTILSLIIGQAFNYSQNHLYELGMGVFLHDIGKVFVPPNILNKSGKLTEDELIKIKKHTWHGFYLLASSSKIPEAATIVALQHHERFDGTGYMQGLKDSDISEYARICSVADVFDALSCNRPYRRAMPLTKVIKHLTEEKGKHFDPQIVDIFIENFRV